MMRYLALIFWLAFSAFAVSLQAQDDRFGFSVQAGPAFSTVHVEQDWALHPDFRTGFFAGASIRVKLSDKWHFPFETAYSSRGFSYQTDATLIYVDGQTAVFRGRIDYRLGYLDLQPRIEFRPVRRLGISAGPYLGFRLSENIRYGDAIGWTDTKENGLYRSTDFGLSARLSGYLGHVLLFIGYQHGLSDVASNIEITDENGQSLGKLGAYTRSLTLGAGFHF